MIIVCLTFQTPTITIPSSLTIDVTSADISADEVQVYDIDVTNGCTCCGSLCCNFTCEVASTNSSQAFYIAAGITLL